MIRRSASSSSARNISPDVIFKKKPLTPRDDSPSANRYKLLTSESDKIFTGKEKKKKNDLAMSVRLDRGEIGRE